MGNEYKVIGEKVAYINDSADIEYWQTGETIREADVKAGRITYPALEALESRGRVEAINAKKVVKSKDLEAK